MLNKQNLANEDTKKIIRHLIEQYKPIAIYLCGSRASGNNNKKSDWDIHLLVNKGVRPLSEKYIGSLIDIKYIEKQEIKTSILETPYSPAVPFLCLYRNDRYLGDLLRLEKRTTRLYAEGPLLWSKAEREENLSKLQRFLNAIELNKQNSIICFRHVCKFYDLALLYWFALRGVWPKPIYEAIEIYKDEDPTFYKNVLLVSKDSLVKDKIRYLKKIYNLLNKYNESINKN